MLLLYSDGCITYLKHKIDRFTADAKQSDDLTMLILQADKPSKGEVD